MFYRNARIEDRIPSYCRAKGIPERPKPTIVFDSPNQPGVVTYGGKLTENLVQAICRDLLAGSLVECERQGLPVVLHVHDEIVVEVDGEKAGEALERLLIIMSTPPAWAAGFPIEVEGFVAKRYVKAPPRGGRVLRARDGLLLSE
jgi:hypothetical protein